MVWVKLLTSVHHEAWMTASLAPSSLVGNIHSPYYLCFSHFQKDGITWNGQTNKKTPNLFTKKANGNNLQQISTQTCVPKKCLTNKRNTKVVSKTNGNLHEFTQVQKTALFDFLFELKNSGREATKWSWRQRNWSFFPSCTWPELFLVFQKRSPRKVWAKRLGSLLQGCPGTEVRIKG